MRWIAFAKAHKALLIVVLIAALAALFLSPYGARLSANWKVQDASHALVVSGNIEAHESVLSFKNVQSRIVSLPIREGQAVRAGDVLAVADSSDYRQQLEIALAGLAVQQRQLEAARQNLVTAERTLQVDEADVKQRLLDQQRALSLQQQGFFAQAALDQTNTAVAQSRAVLERDRSIWTAAARSVDVAQASVRNSAAQATAARMVLGYTTLVAPFDGVVNVQQAEVGEVVVPGTPVVTLTDLDHVWLRAYLNESDLGRVTLGQAVDVRFDGQRGPALQGQIGFIAEKAEFTPKSVETHAERVNLVYRIKVDIYNPGHRLVPGMPADVHIALRGDGQ